MSLPTNGSPWPSEKIQAHHLERLAVVYVRQSTGVTGLARQPKPKTANRLCQAGFGEDKDVQFRAEFEID